MTPEEIRKVNKLVNEKIRENIPLEEFRDTPIEEAKKLGAIALFGEKYGDKVRVVKFGNSVEFCGGCHAKATGNIGLFYIYSESSIAAGVRRIEALTGAAAEELMYKKDDLIEGLKAFFNNAKDLTSVIKKTIEENADLHKQLESFVRKQEDELKDRLIKSAHNEGGVTLIKHVVPSPPEVVKNVIFKIAAEVQQGLFCVIGCVNQGKPTITLMISKDLITDGNLNAGSIVREAAKLIQGGGGGAAHFATAGGKNPDGLNAAIDRAVELAHLK